MNWFTLLAYASAAMPSEITALQRAAFFQRWIGHVGGDGFASDASQPGRAIKKASPIFWTGEA
jgi:hypothetical protein